MMSDLDTFLNNLHHTAKLIVKGKAVVMGNTVEAALVRNLYGQVVVWGMFSVDNRKGKFVGNLANNANTEGVVFRYPDVLPMKVPAYEDWPSPELKKKWLAGIEAIGKTKH